MFSSGEQNHITRIELEPQRHGIDGVSGILGENDLVCRLGVNQFGDQLTRAFDIFIRVAFNSLGNLFGEPVVTPSTATAGIIGIVFVKGGNDLPRYKCGAGIVKVNWRLSIQSSGERWKIISVFLW